MLPITDDGEIHLDGLDEIARGRQREGRRNGPRLERARHDQPGRAAARPGRTSRARSWSSTRRRPRRPGDRRPGARLRLPRHLGAQDVRAERCRRALGRARDPPGDGAVNLGGHMIRKVGRGARPGRPAAQVRGGHVADRRGGRVRRRGRLPERDRPRRDRAARAGARRDALEQLGEIPGIELYGPPADRRAGTSRSTSRDTARRGADPRPRRHRDPRGHHCCQPLMRASASRRRTARALPLLDPGRGRPARREDPKVIQDPARDRRLEQMYREVILDHYENPRGHGVIEDAEAHARDETALRDEVDDLRQASTTTGDDPRRSRSPAAAARSRRRRPRC